MRKREMLTLHFKGVLEELRISKRASRQQWGNFRHFTKLKWANKWNVVGNVSKITQACGGEPQLKVPSGEEHVPSQTKSHSAVTNSPKVLSLNPTKHLGSEVESKRPSQGCPASDHATWDLVADL